MNLFYVLLFVLTLISCSESMAPFDPIEFDLIEDVEMIDQVTVREMQQYWNNPLANGFINNDIDVYRLVYHSDDKRRLASGAILIPKTDNIKGIISLQHATFFADEEAPSENGDFSVVSRKSIFASHGYIVVLPDYYGYGVDKDNIHPYHYAETLTMASEDMLAAAYEYLASTDLTYEAKLFLTGYSEGAYATAALQRKIESTGRWNVTASSLGAGAYNILETVSSFVDIEDLDDDCLPCNAFFLQAYNEQYDLGQDMSYYFNEPYASLIDDGLLLGTFSALEVNRSFPDDPKDLYNSIFLEDYQQDDIELKTALAENSIQDWDILSPTIILHGQNDNVVPYFNSTQLYDQNIENSLVLFRELMAPDHFQGIFEWGLITMDYFDGF